MGGRREGIESKVELERYEYFESRSELRSKDFSIADIRFEKSRKRQVEAKTLRGMFLGFVLLFFGLISLVLLILILFLQSE